MSKKAKKYQKEKDVRVDFTPYGGYEHAFDYFLYALYNYDQIANFANQFAIK